MLFHIEIHHGGIFRNRAGLRYCNGSTNMLSNVDPDMFSWFDLEDAVRDLGYGGGHKVYYIDDLNRGLILLWDDASVIKLINGINDGQVVQVFVEHLIEEPELLDTQCSKGLVNVDGANVEILEQTCNVDVDKKLGSGEKKKHTENVETEDCEVVRSSVHENVGETDNTRRAEVNSEEVMQNEGMVSEADDDGPFQNDVSRNIRGAADAEIEDDVNDPDWEEFMQNLQNESDDSELSLFGDAEEDDFDDGDHYSHPKVVELFDVDHVIDDDQHENMGVEARREKLVSRRAYPTHSIEQQDGGQSSRGNLDAGESIV